MSLCYVYNVNVIPHPRENYIVTLPKIHVCLGPLWQTEIFLPLEKIMDPRMMLVGINRRYEYIGDYMYSGHVFMLLRCFLDEELYQLSIK